MNFKEFQQRILSDITPKRRQMLDYFMEHHQPRPVPPVDVVSGPMNSAYHFTSVRAVYVDKPDLFILLRHVMAAGKTGMLQLGLESAVDKCLMSDTGMLYGKDAYRPKSWQDFSAGLYLLIQKIHQSLK